MIRRAGWFLAAMGLILLLAVLPWGSTANEAASGTVRLCIFFNAETEGNRGAVSSRATGRTALRGRSPGRIVSWRPPSPSSISAVRPFVERIRHRSAYFNAVSVEIKVGNIPRVLALPEVRSVEEVKVYVREREGASPIRYFLRNTATRRSPEWRRRSVRWAIASSSRR